MDCKEAASYLERFIDGELDEGLAQQINLHLASCSICKAKINELEEITAMLLDEPLDMPSPNLSVTILASAEGTLNERSLRPYSPDEIEEETVDVKQLLNEGDETKEDIRFLGPYEVIEPIGSGSMGMVYRGRDRNLDRAVAIKEISPSLAKSEKVIKRFIREARLVASLQHENICAVYYLDVAPDTQMPFIAMEYVEGRTLHKLVKAESPLPLWRSIALVRQVAIALQKAQEKGIIHRDVKPANILITDDDCVKVTDFGLAKALGVDAPLTAVGSIIGTPHFMSPEAARGAASDFRSDLYSLGLTFFYTLAARLPYNTKNIARILEAKQFAPEPDITEFRKDVPEELKTILVRMLAKLPENRYQSFSDFIAALDEVSP